MKRGPRQSRSNWCPGLVLLPALSPTPVLAHAPVQNIGEFVNGVAHPLYSPAHLLILLGLGLMTGQHAPLNLKPTLLVFVPVSALALLATRAGLVTSVYQPILIGIALIVGALVALEKPVSSKVNGALLAGAAMAIGLDSMVESQDLVVVLKTLAGTWTCQLIVVIATAYYVSLGLKWKWIRVGVRVLGSWLVAIALLVLAFSLRR